MTAPKWPAVEDEALVERLLPAIQQAIATVQGEDGAEGFVTVSAPDTANALLLTLSTVLEVSPAAATPVGMRKLAEATSKELLSMMKDTRQLRLADLAGKDTVN